MRPPIAESVGTPTLGLLIVVLLVGAALGLGFMRDREATSESGSATTLALIQEASVLRVGFANEAPYAFQDTASGELSGEAPAIAREVARGLGIARVEGVLTEFGALIPGLQAGRFDVIAAGMYITPPRCGRIAFSRPTYCVDEAFVVRAGNPAALHSYEDVAEHADATLAVVAGTVEQGVAKTLGVPVERLRVFPDAPTALEAVRSGRVTAFAGTELTALDLLGKADDAGLELARPFTGPVVDGAIARGCGAFGFRQDDAALRSAFEDRLDLLLGSERHLELVEPFGFGPDLLPGEIRAAELCRVGGGE